MQEKKESFSSARTFLFVFILCAACALILSMTAEVLKTPQKNAKELYRSKQLLLAARILSYEGYFILNDTPAIYDPMRKNLVPFDGEKPPKAKDEDILSICDARILTRIVNSEGKVFTFEEAGLDEKNYLLDNAKLGYSRLPFKLIYLVKENTPSTNPYGYVIPVNGYGLWDAIYGYLGIKANGNTVLGMTWYDQKETPGLGGEIALPEWQKQFFNKATFQEGTDLERAPLGIKVVKTTVKETFGSSPLSHNAVDGIAGASITVTGVNEALRSSLAPYRPFLIRARKGEVKIDG